MPDNEHPKQHPLVERLVKDASHVPGTKVLAGFLGKSSLDGYTRVYLTPELNEYIEIPDKDLLHSQSLSTDSNQLGGSVVWVQSSADLLHTRIQTSKLQAQFLEGSITSDLLSSTNMLQPLKPQARPTIICTHAIFCSTALCPSQLCETTAFTGCVKR